MGDGDVRVGTGDTPGDQESGRWKRPLVCPECRKGGYPVFEESAKDSPGRMASICDAPKSHLSRMVKRGRCPVTEQGTSVE